MAPPTISAIPSAGKRYFIYLKGTDNALVHGNGQIRVRETGDLLLEDTYWHCQHKDGYFSLYLNRMDAHLGLSNDRRSALFTLPGSGKQERLMFLHHSNGGYQIVFPGRDGHGAMVLHADLAECDSPARVRPEGLVDNSIWVFDEF